MDFYNTVYPDKRSQWLFKTWQAVQEVFSGHHHLILTAS